MPRAKTTGDFGAWGRVWWLSVRPYAGESPALGLFSMKLTEQDMARDGYPVPRRYSRMAEDNGWSPQWQKIEKRRSNHVFTRDSSLQNCLHFQQQLKRGSCTELVHFSFDDCCPEQIGVVNVLCVRFIRSKMELRAVLHVMGECPYCHYF